MPSMRALLRGACACACALALLSPASGAAQVVTDIAVKAAFLPRFARYATWPAGAMPKGRDPFILCVIGDDPFGAVLDNAARAQAVDGRRIAIRRLQSAAGADGCHIAFVEGSRSQPVGQQLAALARKPVLTITDAANSGQRGIIHFTIANGRVRFFIDEAGAAQKRISISSRLLALAIGVRQR